MTGFGRLSLSVKILLLSLCNLGVLAAAAVLLLRMQFGSGSEPMLLSVVSAKMMQVVRQTMADFEHTPRSDWDALLARVSQRTGARAHLTNSRADQVAGPHTLIPAEVRAGMAHAPFPHGQTPPPPIFLVTAGTPSRYWVGGRLPAPGVDGGAMLLLEADSIFNPHLFFDLRLIGWAGAAAAALSFLCWFGFVRNLTRSIRQMEAATARIAEGQFETQAPVRRGDELGHLGSQINRMAGRLSTLVRGQKRFLGDIAHELCAPIARMQMALGVLEQRAEGKHGEELADLREEVEHVSDLVHELLNFSRASLRPGTVKVSALEVAEVVERVVAREAVPGACVQVAVAPGTKVLANDVYFARSLANLVRNAIRYAGHAGPVEVAARPEGREVVLTVADSGPGVAEHELERILEPFYRREESRTRDRGGAGLGLAIVKAGIEACHGTVVCRNRSPHGLEVTLRLPTA